MTKSAAWALREQRIRCNYITVGWMFTEAEDVMQQQGEKRPADWCKTADADHPYGRILRPVDVAKLTVHLLSDDSAMQSGSVIDLHERFGQCAWDA